nr:YetF domain-containing protein [uncultured Lichenicoccus sp.]
MIFEQGRWHENRMNRLRVQRPDVMAGVRQRGLQRLEQIKYAVVERNGKVSVIEREPPPPEES